MTSPRALIGGVAALVVLLVLGVLGAYALGAKGHDKPGSESVTVAGSGKVTVVPDLLIADLTIHVTRDTNAAALADGNAIEAKVTAALQKAGVAKKDIRTTGFSVNPHYDYSRGGERQAGYDADHSIRVYARDLDTAGKVIGDAVTAGGNAVRVQGTRLTLSDKDAAMAEAREKAMKDAKARAKAYAAAGGRDLGEVVTIRENSASAGYQPAAIDGFDAKASAAGAAVPIEPGEQKLSVSVQVVYELD
ncbi:SIMPL domain-containing protein [Nocardioides jiangxiensis]|uniref:SIMPL domain-containing protein n=1 Tax=Nocardioides jiangxiensis TaxID=3064524 RepID=A0ABT9AX56_9ACTN|nr:SIMPL domain-containing protein [Nocardioides sp. WY-20]MDO7866902.1 SIMPL domain-containing protein [Nocardioides sp. WY-20]